MVTSILVTDHFALTLQACCTGMDQTPGGKDESAVVEAHRLGEEVDVERRVQLLISFTTQVVFGYVAQVWSRHCHAMLVHTLVKSIESRQGYSAALTIVICSFPYCSWLGTCLHAKIQIWKEPRTAGLATDHCTCDCRVCLNATS